MMLTGAVLWATIVALSIIWWLERGTIRTLRRALQRTAEARDAAMREASSAVYSRMALHADYERRVADASLRLNAIRRAKDHTMCRELAVAAGRDLLSDLSEQEMSPPNARS